MLPMRRIGAAYALSMLANISACTGHAAGSQVDQPAETAAPGGTSSTQVTTGRGTQSNAGSEGGAGVRAQVDAHQTAGLGGDAGRTAGTNARSAGAGSGGAGVSGSGGAGAGAFMGGSSAPRPKLSAAAGTTLVRIDPSVRHQTFEGWGTSLCWWANHVGGWSATARDAVVAAVVDPVEGLGYNVFRYNIGGGEAPGHTHMGPHKAMPGFKTAAGAWTWDADANQRAMLDGILKRGSGVILEAFSNSPPYWMTKSGCASGNTDGSSNLKDDSYEGFADYLTEVVKHFNDSFGIAFRTLEPLNEPSANWWKSNGGQEGCHFSPTEQQRIVQAVAAKLTAKGLSNTTVSASDENSLDDALTNLRKLDAATLSMLGQLNVHSYAGTRRQELRTLATAANKRLWQSESGPLGQTLADDTEAALFMAGRIITDLRELQPEAWVDWQVGDPSRNWASLALDDTRQTFTPLKRFYMHAGFSRYIRPGASFIDIDNADMVAALSPDGKTLTMVVRNADRSANKRFTFDLTAFASVGATAQPYCTSRTENLASQPALQIENWTLVTTVPAYSVTTYVVPLQP